MGLEMRGDLRDVKQTTEGRKSFVISKALGLARAVAYINDSWRVYMSCLVCGAGGVEASAPAVTCGVLGPKFRHSEQTSTHPPPAPEP